MLGLYFFYFYLFFYFFATRGAVQDLMRAEGKVSLIELCPQLLSLSLGSLTLEEARCRGRQLMKGPCLWED